MSKATAKSTYLHLKMDVAFVPEENILEEPGNWWSGGVGEKGEVPPALLWQRTKPKLRLKTIINTWSKAIKE